MSVSDVIGVTGGRGFFGWHLRSRLHSQNRTVVTADRATFAEPDALRRFAQASGAVVHVAGVNRAGSARAVFDGNLRLAEDLAQALLDVGSTAPVVFVNSVKAGEPTPYGESKAHAAELLGGNAKARGAAFIDLRLPHLFGEFGRPHYNSAVTTFASELVRGEPSQVDDGRLELLHAQDAAESLLAALRDPSTRTIDPPGKEIGVRQCYAILERLAEYRIAGEIPLLEGRFELQLFNMIRSQMWPWAYPMPLTRHADHRGAFFEVVRAHGQGQTSISTTAPGVTRGEHFHFEKVERFVVVSGQASIKVRRLLTDELVAFDVDGNAPSVVDMPPLCTHNISNTGDGELVTLFWSHDHFDPDRADTNPEPVEPPS